MSLIAKSEMKLRYYKKRCNDVSQQSIYVQAKIFDLENYINLLNIEVDATL